MTIRASFYLKFQDKIFTLKVKIQHKDDLFIINDKKYLLCHDILKSNFDILNEVFRYKKFYLNTINY